MDQVVLVVRTQMDGRRVSSNRGRRNTTQLYAYLRVLENRSKRLTVPDFFAPGPGVPFANDGGIMSTMNTMLGSSDETRKTRTIRRKHQQQQQQQQQKRRRLQILLLDPILQADLLPSLRSTMSQIPRTTTTSFLLPCLENCLRAGSDGVAWYEGSCILCFCN